MPTGWRGGLVYVVLFAGGPLTALMFAALAPVLPSIVAHFGGGEEGAFAAQLVMTAPSLGVLLGGILGGFAIERWGVRPVLFMTLATYGFAGASGAFLDDLAALLAARFAVGFSVALIGTSVGVIVGAWFDGVKRRRLLGYQAAAGGLFSVTCLLLSGTLSDMLGWRSAFMLYAVALIVLGVALVTISATSVPSQKREEKLPLKLLAPLRPIYALGTFLFVAYFMTSLQLSLLLGADGVASAVTRSMVIATGVLAGALASAAYGFVFARFGELGTQTVLMLMLGGGILLIGLSTSLPVIALGAAISGAGGGLLSPHLGSLLLERVSPELRPRAFGLKFTVLYVANFLNPLVVTPLRASFGSHGSYICVGLFVSAVAVVLPLVMKRAVGVAPAR